MKKLISLLLLSIISISAWSDNLMSSIENKDLATLEKEIANGSDLNKMHSNYGGFRNMTPVAWSVKKKNIDALKLLLSKGANPNSTGGDGSLPALTQVSATSSISLTMALEMTQLLLDSGADINKVTLSNANVLHSAAYTNREVVIKLLLSKGANKNQKNSDGETPYDIAVLFNTEPAKSLLK